MNQFPLPSSWNRDNTDTPRTKESRKDRGKERSTSPILSKKPRVKTSDGKKAPTHSNSPPLISSPPREKVNKKRSSDETKNTSRHSKRQKGEEHDTQSKPNPKKEPILSKPDKKSIAKSALDEEANKKKKEQDVLILKPEEVLCSTFALTHLPPPTQQLNSDLVMKAIDTLKRSTSESKAFRQAYIVWHLFMESCLSLPSFKFFKYKDCVVGDCLLNVQGHPHPASCLAALPEVEKLLQALASPCKQYAKIRACLLWLELVEGMGYSMRNALGTRMPAVAEDGTPEVVVWHPASVELFAAAYSEMFFSSRRITKEEVRAPTPPPAPVESKDKEQGESLEILAQFKDKKECTVKVVGVLDGTVDEEIIDALSQGVGVPPLKVCKEPKSTGVWLSLWSSPQEADRVIQKGSTLMIGGAYSTLCGEWEVLEDIDDEDKLTLQEVFPATPITISQAPQIQQMLQDLNQLKSKLTSEKRAAVDQMNYLTKRLVSNIWGLVDNILEDSSPNLPMAREYLLMAEKSLQAPSRPFLSAFHNDEERIRAQIGCHHRLSEVERLAKSWKLAAVYKSKAVQAEIEVLAGMGKTMSRATQVKKRQAVAELAASGKACGSYEDEEKCKDGSKLESVILRYTLDLPVLYFEDEQAEPLRPNIVVQASSESKAYRLLGRAIQQRIPDLIMYLRTELSDVPPEPDNMQRAELLDKIRKRIRQFKGQLAEDGIMKTKWREALRKDRQVEKATVAAERRAKRIKLRDEELKRKQEEGPVAKDKKKKSKAPKTATELAEKKEILRAKLIEKWKELERYELEGRIERYAASPSHRSRSSSSSSTGSSKSKQTASASEGWSDEERRRISKNSTLPIITPIMPTGPTIFALPAFPQVIGGQIHENVPLVNPSPYVTMPHDSMPLLWTGGSSQRTTVANTVRRVVKN